MHGLPVVNPPAFDPNLAIPSTLGGINLLPEAHKRLIYARLTPPQILERFQITPDLYDANGNDLLQMIATPHSSNVELSVFPYQGAPDPVLYGHLSDTVHGHLHILLYVINDPHTPRFDIDCLPDGTSTQFGTQQRNLEAEQAAMQAGLAPGQIRSGLRLLPAAIQAFEEFVKLLGHTMYFTEPLYYHNAVLFERYGMAYEKGRKLMERIQQGFAPDGDLSPLLDGSTPFRQPDAARSIRLRSWALHDNLMGEQFRDVTMYKVVGKSAQVSTTHGCDW